MKKFAKMAVAAAVAGFTFAASANVVIDDFSVGQGIDAITGDNLLLDKSANNIGVYNSANGLTSQIIGGQRDIFIEKLGNTNPLANPLAGQVSGQVDGSLLSYSTAAGVYGTSIIKWDGAATGSTAVTTGSKADFLGTTDFNGLNHYNLAATGSAFLINVWNSDIGFDFALTAFTSDTQWTTLVLASAQHKFGVPASSPIQFADFFDTTANDFGYLGSGALRLTGSAGGANMADIGALTATVNWSGGTGTVDLQILDATTVPEPESLALVGLGLLGLAASRRRKAAK